MELLLPIVCAAILLGVAYFVARPLLAGAAEAPVLTRSARPVWQMHERKERLYGAIKELELDHSQDKLSDADYRDQRRSLETEALIILEQLDQSGGTDDEGDLLDQIEADIRSLRRGACPECGHPRRSGDRFCAQCGTALGAG